MKSLPFCLVIAVGGLAGSSAAARAQQYFFTTIAGTAGQVASADGTNSDARFNFPSGIAIDASGNLYVGDTSNHTIRKMTPMGTNWVVTTIAGLALSPGFNDGTNSDARLNRPNGVAVDPNGNLFVVDHYNHTIRKITPVDTNWVVSTIAGTAGVRGWADGTNGDAQFWSPTGIALDKQGSLFVADSSNYTIRKITPQGTNWVVSTIAGWANHPGFADGPNSSAQFNAPYDVVVDGQGDLFVVDFYVNNVIRKIVPVGLDWETSTIAGWAGTQGSANGTNESARFHWPIGIAVDSGGSLYVTDQFNDTIRKVTPAGADWVTTTIAGAVTVKGSTDGLGSDVRFYQPWGIKLDRAGNLYVVDWHNSTIRMGILLPALQVALSAQQIVLSWPGSAASFILETSASLDAGAAWTMVTNGVVNSSNGFVLTNDLAGAAAFYRLRYP
jgi:hypothetical protein